MRSKNFWKRVVSFLLAFWLGLSIVSLFASDNLPSAEVSNKYLLEEKNVSEKENKNIHLTLEKKNCASADVNLKYKFLSDGKNQMENADKAQINRTENQAKVG